MERWRDTLTSNNQRCVESRLFKRTLPPSNDTSKSHSSFVTPAASQTTALPSKISSLSINQLESSGNPKKLSYYADIYVTYCRTFRNVSTVIQLLKSRYHQSTVCYINLSLVKLTHNRFWWAKVPLLKASSSTAAAPSSTSTTATTTTATSTAATTSAKRHEAVQSMRRKSKSYDPPLVVVFWPRGCKEFGLVTIQSVWKVTKLSKLVSRSLLKSRP